MQRGLVLLENELLFRQRLNSLIGEADVPMSQLSRECGLGPNVIRLALSNGYASMRTIILICRRFKVSSDWLMGLSGKRER